jgi:hypothetical protein
VTGPQGLHGTGGYSAVHREYFVLRGSTIGYVSMSSASNLPATYDDSAQLSAIASHLCVYGGPCHWLRHRETAHLISSVRE